jgi:hypothetical protein
MPRELVHEESFCCGYKRCPVVREYSDGSIEISDAGDVVKFDPEQAARLRVLLNPPTSNQKDR